MSPFERIVIDEARPKILSDALVPIRRVGRGLPRHGRIVACGSDRDRPRRQYSVPSLHRGARKQRHGDDTSDGPHDCPLCPLTADRGFLPRWFRRNLAGAANETEQERPAISAGFLGECGFLDRKKASVTIPTQLPGPTRAIAKDPPSAQIFASAAGRATSFVGCAGRVRFARRSSRRLGRPASAQDCRCGQGAV